MKQSTYPVTISGVGKCLPNTIITNTDLEKQIDTTDEWIKSRSGIEKRHVVSGNETVASLATKAGEEALAFAGLKPEEVDLIICATSLPDNLYPSMACEVQGELGAINAAAFDITAACSGLIYGLSIAKNFIMSGTYKNILLIGADVHSRFVDWNDRSTCVLFGDGAGALVVTRAESDRDDLLAIDIKANGAKANELKIPLSGRNCPLVKANDVQSSFVQMNGKEIYKFAINTVPQSILAILNKLDLNIDAINKFILHQANIRIIHNIADKLKIDKSKFYSNLHKYGNTSAASIAIALTEAVEEKELSSGDLFIMSGFGAGLTWGTAVVRWNAVDKRNK